MWNYYFLWNSQYPIDFFFEIHLTDYTKTVLSNGIQSEHPRLLGGTVGSIGSKGYDTDKEAFYLDSSGSKSKLSSPVLKEAFS